MNLEKNMRNIFGHAIFAAAVIMCIKIFEPKNYLQYTYSLFLYFFI